ncbi:MAG: lamin tail domain-containing protein, partial [Chitinophagales bacterium]|nr:lamin tail domain-containing protein [Chitinophagales bacterium]
MHPKFILFITLLVCSLSNVIAQVQDDFTDGDFTNAPAWNGDAAKFEINATNQLHLNAPAVTDTAYISTPNTAINDIEWDFFYTMDFAPSSSNFLKVYLVSDQQNFKQPLNGYFLRMGTDGSNDAIELYLQQGTTETLLIHGIDGHVAASTNSVSVKVTRDGSGNWSVFSDITGGTNYSLEGSATDNTFSATNYFGFFCKYTSTRSTLFFFDNIYVDAPFVDNTPPQALQVTIISANQLDVHYSEPVDATTSENELNYSVNNGIGFPSSALIDGTDKSLVHLTFANNFQSAITNTISISNINDIAGNTLTLAALDFTFYQSQPSDVLINEIMADPSPVVGLPVAEFVELYNNSTTPVDLTGWEFSDASTTQTLSSFTLQPNSYLILCDDANAASLQANGNVLALASFPSLNNDGDDLSLKDASGNLINAVSYDLSWYQDGVK